MTMTLNPSLSCGRTTRRSAIIACLILGLLLPTASYGAWKLYGGVGGGLSRLQPTPADRSETVSDDLANTLGVFAGMDLTHRYSVEAGFYSLGSVGLSGGADVSYRALSGSMLVHVFGKPAAIANRYGPLGYFRLGVNRISTDSSANLTGQDGIGLMFGTGAQWPVTDHWHLRGELGSYDSGAAALTVSLVYRPYSKAISARPRLSTIGLPDAPVQTPEQDEQVDEVPLASATGASAPGADPVPSTPDLERENPQETRDDIDTDKVADELVQNEAGGDLPREATSRNATCSPPTIGEPTDARGCALFTGVLANVGFEAGSERLQDAGHDQLQRLAALLQQIPATRIELWIHLSAEGGSPEAHYQRGMQRARTIARYLVSRGADAGQLGARVFGNADVEEYDTSGTPLSTDRLEIRWLDF